MNNEKNRKYNRAQNEKRTRRGSSCILRACWSLDLSRSSIIISDVDADTPIQNSRLFQCFVLFFSSPFHVLVFGMKWNRWNEIKINKITRKSRKKAHINTQRPAPPSPPLPSTTTTTNDLNDSCTFHFFFFCNFFPLLFGVFFFCFLFKRIHIFRVIFIGMLILDQTSARFTRDEHTREKKKHTHTMWKRQTIWHHFTHSVSLALFPSNYSLSSRSFLLLLLLCGSVRWAHLEQR